LTEKYFYFIRWIGMIHTFKSQRGGDKYASGGYIYFRERIYDDHITLRCERKAAKTNACPGRAKIDEGEDEIEIVQEHNHMPDPARVEAEVAKVIFIYSK
jgi:hypothetical protein